MAVVADVEVDVNFDIDVEATVDVVLRLDCETFGTALVRPSIRIQADDAWTKCWSTRFFWVTASGSVGTTAMMLKKYAYS